MGMLKTVPVDTSPTMSLTIHQRCRATLALQKPLLSLPAVPATRLPRWANRHPPRGFAPRTARRYTKPREFPLLATGTTSAVPLRGVNFAHRSGVNVESRLTTRLRRGAAACLQILFYFNPSGFAAVPAEARKAHLCQHVMVVLKSPAHTRSSCRKRVNANC